MTAVTCPRCGQHSTSSAVTHGYGRYLCDCGTLHDGATDAAWGRWAGRRAVYQAYASDPRHTPDLTATGGVIEEF